MDRAKRKIIHKITTKSVFFLIVTAIEMAMVSLPSLATTFSDQWQDMQHIYDTMIREFAKKPDIEREFTHPYWAATRQSIRRSLLGPANTDFLASREIFETMVRSDSSYTQHYEIAYLTHCISDKTRKRVERFSETSFGSLPITINEFTCTTNSLGQLYYAARISELTENVPLQTIVEFGGGFGNLARIFKLMDPNITYIIVDFPELLALQYLYIKNSLTGPSLAEVPIVVHTEKIHDLTPGSIHLVPVYLLETLQVRADVFISCFGLSEAPRAVQDLLTHKKFFDASWCYLTGQLKPGWKHVDFVHHNVLLNNMRKNYLHVTCQPFHLLPEKFMELLSYEIETSGPQTTAGFIASKD